MNGTSRCAARALLVSILALPFAVSAEPIAYGAARMQPAMQHAPIKSAAALREHAADAAAPSPLAKLSAQGRRRFIESVTFNEKGLTGFSYADLRAELAPGDLYRVLQLFGYQHLTARIAGVAPMPTNRKTGGDQRGLTGFNDDEDDDSDEPCWDCEWEWDWDWSDPFNPGTGAKDHYEYRCDRLVGGAPTSTCIEAKTYICTRNC